MAAAPNFAILNNGSDAQQATTHEDAKDVVSRNASHELVFAVVGHVGSGTSEIAKVLETALKDNSLPGGAYDCFLIKARDVISEWAAKNNFQLAPLNDKTMKATELLQDCGDDMRSKITASGEHDFPAVAKGLVRKIMEARKETKIASDGTVGTRRRKAYILDALRHPAEVHLLRRIYQEAFVLVGVVCEEGAREIRILDKFPDAGKEQAKEFMKRDAKADEKYGQRVSDTFHLADFFLDNTSSRLLKGVSNPLWDINEKLGRLVKIVTHAQVIRPKIEETAMHHAHLAMMRSACLSRQVGAAVLSMDGDIVSTGTNEVPKGGGGVYGDPRRASLQVKLPSHEPDSRCAIDPKLKFCSNTHEQNTIVDELIAQVEDPEQPFDSATRSDLARKFRATSVGGLLEFSRAVHAEMDALLTAGRTGASTVGTRVFVTTFPCHYCARHIVTAGVDEVQYIEPYPKSRALKLHSDSIAMEAEDWVPPSQGGTTVLFRPFSGVAPRLYKRAFLKDRDLKDNLTGEYKVGVPEWGNPYYLSKTGYQELEAELAME